MDRDVPPSADLWDAGQVFRRERLRRHLSVADASTETRIRSSIIAAIEDGQLSKLPSPVFARGLIRTYARYLESDPRPYLAMYAAVAPDANAAVNSSRHSHVSRGNGAFPTILVPIVIVASLALLGGYLFQQYAAFVAEPALVAARPSGGSILISTPLPSPPAAARVATTTPIALAALATPLSAPTLVVAAQQPIAILTATPVAQSTPTPASGVRIDAVAVARVWVQVEVDGQVSYAGILNPGDRKSWSANQKIMVWSGNASSLNVTFNGKAVGSLGAPGEVVKVTWTATS